MPMTKEQILAEVMALEPKLREELIEDLRQVADEDELTPELRAELRRRVAEMERGEATLVPGEQVMRELRERLGAMNYRFTDDLKKTSGSREVLQTETGVGTMPMTREQIFAEAMSLDPRDRQELADDLLVSLSDAEREAIDAAWLAEARRREEAFARGEMSTSPVDEVIARIQTKSRR